MIVSFVLLVVACAVLAALLNVSVWLVFGIALALVLVVAVLAVARARARTRP